MILTGVMLEAQFWTDEGILDGKTGIMTDDDRLFVKAVRQILLRKSGGT